MVLHGVVHEAVKISRVAPRHTCGADDVFKNEVPANHKGCQLSHSHIAEGSTWCLSCRVYIVWNWDPHTIYHFQTCKHRHFLPLAPWPQIPHSTVQREQMQLLSKNIDHKLWTLNDFDGGGGSLLDFIFQPATRKERTTAGPAVFLATPPKCFFLVEVGIT